MMRFHFEKNLEHQNRAVESIINVFKGVEIIEPFGIEKEYVNPIFNKDTNFSYVNNIGSIQEQNDIKRNVKGKSNIIDIMMETGTGKTYTYTKTIFELNKLYGIFKFIIVVPTIAIKAGTINFLRSESAREHFKDQYGKIIELHVVASQKSNKNKKLYMPQAVSNFVNAGRFEKDKIHVLIINLGMINSPTMKKSYDKTLLDKYSVPFDAIASVNPFMIIDEPHKFTIGSETWKNIQKMKPQFILRFGATFKEYKNLIYTLTAAEAFNRNLVKGVIGHVTEFEEGKNVFVRFVNSNGKEATFELTKKGSSKKNFKLIKNESLEKIHPAMKDLIIEKLNKNTIILSNGLELKKGDKINPYSYAEKLQEIMIKEAVKNHFKLEKEYLTRNIKIKPLTLFFIDNIDEYRNKEGYIRKTLENYVELEIKELLKKEENEFYRNYLKKTLEDISKTHGGYFAADKGENDEVIEKEVNEILHDKQAILDLENPRRFIFSKWTLREGWDNPNVFQICKLRSSGSEISKLQEVGRGLRLPVNQYGNRVKNEQFYLHYFVDFTENDFVEKLVKEINDKSGAISREDKPEKLDDVMIKRICKIYKISEEELLETLDKNNVITRTNKFKENGFEYIKKNYPLIFNGVNSNKIKKDTEFKKKVKIRVEKYPLLKELWEKLNEKVILEYKIKNEEQFKEIFLDFLKKYEPFKPEKFQEKIKKVNFENYEAMVNEEVSIYGEENSSIQTMSYEEFLKELSKKLYINIKTLHNAFVESKIEMNKYLNQTTIRLFKQKFDNYLMYNALNKFSIEYQKVTGSIHPTKITNSDGMVKKEIDSSDIGIFYSEEQVSDDYLFEELFYDSDLERENIKKEIKEIIVFTKIPKNSIKIPIAGGKTYSPDFAYVLDYENGQKKMYFIVETKDTDKDSLRDEERIKIKHAEKFFGDTIKIKFKTQFKDEDITNLIKEIYKDI
ncbi:restriction endonuclease EcoPI subunit R [Marinitoga sp. 1135]|uniref:type III restriction-modification system endonuclease n=1 Tax=Marinitoga sp. 1135 TaxID=1643333 RepID=UPI001586AEFF|nr:type III restriction-modification system endonuclease [Marinitoga sp. 1135]NUU94910.1 restriction endonuclease EcoPI subunit R [Marinitoga sp. 1135]